MAVLVSSCVDAMQVQQVASAVERRFQGLVGLVDPGRQLDRMQSLSRSGRREAIGVNSACNWR